MVLRKKNFAKNKKYEIVKIRFFTIKIRDFFLLSPLAQRAAAAKIIEGNILVGKVRKEIIKGHTLEKSCDNVASEGLPVLASLNAGFMMSAVTKAYHFVHSDFKAYFVHPLFVRTHPIFGVQVATILTHDPNLHAKIGFDDSTGNRIPQIMDVLSKVDLRGIQRTQYYARTAVLDPSNTLQMPLYHLLPEAVKNKFLESVLPVIIKKYYNDTIHIYSEGGLVVANRYGAGYDYYNPADPRNLEVYFVVTDGVIEPLKEQKKFFELENNNIKLKKDLLLVKLESKKGFEEILRNKLKEKKIEEDIHKMAREVFHEQKSLNVYLPKIPQEKLYDLLRMRIECYFNERGDFHMISKIEIYGNLRLDDVTNLISLYPDNLN